MASTPPSSKQADGQLVSDWLFQCSVASAAQGPAHGLHTSDDTKYRPIIDMHCHTLCVAVEKLVGPHPRKRQDQAQMDMAQGSASVAHNTTMLADVGPKLTQVNQRLADMDAMGVAVQVLSPAPNQYYYWAEDDLAEEVVRLQNQHIASLCAQHPTRFSGLGTLALQNPRLAVEQLETAVHEYGLRGVEISSTVNGVSIADPCFHPFWARAEELGCTVLLHPLGSEMGTRLDRHYLWNVIGQPLETTIAVSELILGGLFDRFPATKLCTCHGGGYLPAYWGRLDHAWRVRPEARTTVTPPSDYLRRVFFDTVVYDPLQLRHLIDKVGVSQLVVGTDYPFDMGHYQITQLVDAVAGLTEEERCAILAGNAQRLLRLQGEAAFAPGLVHLQSLLSQENTCPHP